MKTMKFRIEPNSEQRGAIDHNIEANRLVYNNFLTACRSVYDDTGKLPTVFDLNKLGTRMRHDCAFVAEAYSLTLNETAKRALTACQRTLAEHMHSWGVYNLETGFSKDPFHFPRYRSRTQFDSFTYPSARDYSIVTEKNSRGCNVRRLRLGKVPGLIRCYNQRTKLKGDLRTCTIVRKDMGKYCLYYACIAYEPLPEKSKKDIVKAPVGVDIGISNIVALSDGTVFPGEHPYLRREKELKKESERLSRTLPYTEEYDKQRTKLNHIYSDIDNHRKNTIETISRYIADRHDVIAMEDLSVRALRIKAKNSRMVKGYNDVRLGELRRRIQSKAESAGGVVVLVNPRDTSQICSGCGTLVKKDLSVRIHVCPVCDLKIDRDVNAARNILARALSITPMGSTGDPRPGHVRAEKPAA